MTLNTVIAIILRFSPSSMDFQADYITVVEDRPIMSVKIVSPSSSLPLLAKTITHPAARSLSAIAEHLVKYTLGHGSFARKAFTMSASLLCA